MLHYTQSYTISHVKGKLPQCWGAEGRDSGTYYRPSTRRWRVRRNISELDKHTFDWGKYKLLMAVQSVASDLKSGRGPNVEPLSPS